MEKPRHRESRTVEPFVPIPEDMIPKMLTLARPKPRETLYDLGSGDGRIVIAAARDFHAKAVGIETRRLLVRKSRKRIKESGLNQKVKIVRRGFMAVSLRKADVLALYLSSYALSRLARKFKKELRPGARIVTFDFSIPDWTPSRELKVTPKGWKTVRSIYLYRVPFSIS
jgi:cyclopropane fatty-acyl-phospholipid synthase-like methyltransferase